jgi:hypothetical protein
VIPQNFTTFFAIMAGVGATLFGLIFVAITIRPELTRSNQSSLLPQFRVASSYTALLNPLVISLFALVPHTTIGGITTVMSSIGLVTSGLMAITLVQIRLRWTKKVLSALFILVSLLMYGFELDFAIQLVTTPQDVQWLFSLTSLLILIYLYGIARAWDLVGARQFHTLDVLAQYVPERIRESFVDTSPESGPPKPEN